MPLGAEDLLEIEMRLARAFLRSDLLCAARMLLSAHI